MTVGLVTGAARGMGRACAELLAQPGRTLVLTDIDADALADTATSFGADALPWNVSDPSSVAALPSPASSAEQGSYIMRAWFSTAGLWTLRSAHQPEGSRS